MPDRIHMTAKKQIKALTGLLLAAVLCFAMRAPAYADYIQGYFRYTVSDGSVTITAYTGDESAVTVPDMIAGNPVGTIAAGAFAESTDVVTVYLPETVTAVEPGAFGPGQGVVHLSSQPDVPAADPEPVDQEDIPDDENSSSPSQGSSGSTGTGSNAGASAGNGGASAGGSANQTGSNGNRTGTGGQTGAAGNHGNAVTEVDIEEESAETPAPEQQVSEAPPSETPAAEPAQEITPEPEQPVPQTETELEQLGRSLLIVLLLAFVLALIVGLLLARRTRKHR